MREGGREEGGGRERGEREREGVNSTVLSCDPVRTMISWLKAGEQCCSGGKWPSLQGNTNSTLYCTFIHCSVMCSASMAAVCMNLIRCQSSPFFGSSLQLP